jgi:hypothetical protein
MTIPARDNWLTQANAPFFDVRRSYGGVPGAKGDGSTNDAAAFQAAANAAIAAQGTLFIPPPAVYYAIPTTIALQAVAGGAQFRLNMVGDGSFGAIRWTGAANGILWRAFGWKNSTIRGVKCTTGAAGTILWDLDADVTRPSLTDLTFENCFRGPQHPRPLRRRGGSNATGGNRDTSDVVWVNCRVVGSRQAAGGDIAYQNLSQNGLHYQWFGGFTNSCYNLARNLGGYTLLNGAINASVTTITVNSTLGFPPSGRLLIESEQVDYTGVSATTFTGVTRGVAGTTAASHGHGFGVAQVHNGAVLIGGTSHSLYGMGASGNACEFLTVDVGTLGVWGGRWEDGGCFVQAGLGGSNAPVSVKLDNVSIHDYLPADGVLFKLYMAADLLLDGCSVKKDVPFTSAMIDTTGSGSTARGVVNIRAGSYSAAWPPYTAIGNNWRFNIDALQLSDGSTVVGRYPVGETVTYATTYTPRPFFQGQVKSMTLAGPLTVNAPVGNPVIGDNLEFVFVQDAAGGRVVTWDAAFDLNWTPDTAPNKVNGIAFRYNGSKWAQTGLRTIALASVVGATAALAGKINTTDVLAYGGPNLSGFGSAATKTAGNAVGNLPMVEGDGKLNAGILRAGANQTWTVTDQTAMLALSSAIVGDYAIQTASSPANQLFYLNALPPSTLANWIGPISGVSVSSVNTFTGNVSLGTSNVPETGGVLYFTNARAVTALAGRILSNVTETSVGSLDVLQWNGTAWVNRTLAAAGISAVGHNHNDLYYTEAEVDGFLAGKSAVGHLHTSLDVTDFSSAVSAVIAGTAINALSDVSVASPATGNVLRYNGTVFVNATLGAADIGAGTVSGTEFGYLAGVTSAIQTQLNGKVGTTWTLTATAPLTGGGDASANRSIGISAATASAAGSMSAADKAKLDRVGTVVSAGTITTNYTPDAAAGDEFDITLGAATVTINAPTNATNGRRVMYRFRQDGTGNRGIALNAIFRFGADITGYTPSTAINKTDYVQTVYNSTDTKWDVVSVIKGL